mgnify:CR=1 FL=1
MVPWLAKYASAGPLKAADAFRTAPSPGSATKADAKTRQVALSGSGCSFLGFKFGPRPATSGGPPLVAGRGPNLKPGREHLEKVLIGQFLVSIRTYGILTERRGFQGHVAHGSPPAARRRGIARVGVSCIELHGA